MDESSENTTVPPPLILGPESGSGAGGGLLRTRSRLLPAALPLIPIVVAFTLLSSTATRAAPATALRAVAPLLSTSVGGQAGQIGHLTPQLPASLLGALSDHPVGHPVALVVHPTSLHSSPGGPVIAPQPLRTTFGSPTVLLVRRTVPGWVGVLSPLVGNGRIAWLPTSDVALNAVNWTIEVSLATRRLTVLEGDRVEVRYEIAIGRPTAPTPTGEFAVTDRLETGDPTGPYGCCIIATSALAPHAIADWDGGDRIAIHSSPDYSTIGEAVSHGCMHVTLPEGQWLMHHIPLGTPVIIRS